MNVLGVNAGRIGLRGPHADHLLADGSAALLCDGRVSRAVIEERLTRARYAGGFRRSAAKCLESTSLAAIDVYALSSCCGTRWSSADAAEHLGSELTAAGLAKANAIVRAQRVIVVDHHLSHAMLAFASAPSSAEPTLVCVLDGMGNRLDDSASEAWWQGRFQRQSYYLARWVDGLAKFELVHEEATGADEIGVGEIYRAVTHVLGWHSYQHAGKTMALAAFGNAHQFPGVSFVQHDSARGIVVPVCNLHDRPLDQVRQVLRHAGYDLPTAFDPSSVGPENTVATAIAAIVQRQLEQALVERVGSLAERFGVRRVAFAGGVALNCVALGAVRESLPGLQLHVPCAPADTGQALGNALYAAHAQGSPWASPMAPGAVPARCDFGHHYTGHEIAAALENFRLARRGSYRIERIRDADRLAATAADAVAAGAVIGLRQGGAEYGPRALGHASIVADPRSAEMHARVNSHKQREPFRPYAPSILAEHATAWFEDAFPSPFMSFAGRWRTDAARRVPAVVHVDGSARYHTVAAGSGFYRRLIEAFMQRSAVPVLLNTSFNGHGEPIVETPDDALNALVKMNLDGLVLEDHFITRIT
ncbi:carbamoyltransferase C-terminal domain-containing protein [Paucibacter sp. JuS9]|uniref:carbamoyltransferase C-terminal domain-containing protein n=1 Tax=Paucibacter sp. JuS9 TaxID=3228748 RepID=UPI0037575CC1